VKTNKFISGIVSALLIAANIPAALPTNAAGQTYTLNGAGQHKGTGPDGYSYEIWAADTNQPSSMTLGDNGTFTTKWTVRAPAETSSLAAVSIWGAQGSSRITMESLAISM